MMIILGGLIVLYTALNISWLVTKVLPIVMYLNKDCDELEVTILQVLGCIVFLPATVYGFTALGFVKLLNLLCKISRHAPFKHKSKVIFKRTRQ